MSKPTLKEFIAQSLIEMIDGVAAAQTHAATVGAVINPGVEKSIVEGELLFNPVPNNERVQQVTFDVLVDVVESDQGKAGLAVFSGAFNLGTQASLSDTRTFANRLQFTVDVRFPPQAH